MKKAIVSILTAAMLATLISGCGGSTTAAPQSAQSESGEPAETDKPSAPAPVAPAEPEAATEPSAPDPVPETTSVAPVVAVVAAAESSVDFDEIARQKNINERLNAFTQLDLNGIKLEMVRITAGTFTMGSPDKEVGRSDNETQIEVQLTRDYLLGKYEVTQAQYERVMRKNNSHFSGNNQRKILIGISPAIAASSRCSDGFAWHSPSSPPPCPHDLQ